MTHDDETLMRRIDGEMPIEQRQTIDAAAAADPALADRLQALRAAGSAARSAFPIAPDVRDADLARLIAAGPARSASGWSRLADHARGMFARPTGLDWAAVAAAAFVAGLVIRPGLGDRPALAVGADGGLTQTALVRVLDTRLAGQGADSQGRAVDLTFKDAEGRWCRTFRDGRASLAGLACRSEGRWRLEALAPVSGGGEVRMASSQTPAPVLAAVDVRLAGQALDVDQERRARDAGWR